MRIAAKDARALLAAVLIAGSFGPAVAGDEPGGGRIQLPVTSFTLDNQLQVVVVEDHRSPVVTHMVWYRVGSADEPAGKSGIAHFLEHLMFKGTESTGPGEFSEQVAINGGTDNAFTSQDYTAYHQRIARDRLGIVMRLEADRMANLRLGAEDVEVEREVVLEERAQRYGNEPGALLSEQMDAALYLNHPYGRPIIGWEHEIRQLTLEDAVAFYERYYAPSNVIVVIAGDVTPDEARALAGASYGSLANRAPALERVRPGEPPPRAARRVELAHPQVSVERLRRVYLAPSYSTAERRMRAALALLGEIAGGGSSSRMYRELVVERKVAVDAGAYYSGLGLDYGEFGLSASPAAGTSLGELESEIDRLVADLKENGVSEAEIERAKTKLIAESVFDQDSQTRMARMFGAALTTGLTVEEVKAWPADLRVATREDVVAAARAYLLPERSVTGLLKLVDATQEKIQ